MAITLTEAERERVARALRSGMTKGKSRAAGTIALRTLKAGVDAVLAEVDVIAAEREAARGDRMIERLKEIAAEPGYRERVRQDLEQWLAEDAEARADDEAWNRAVAENRERIAAAGQTP